jgi:uncharacterized membrane protein
MIQYITAYVAAGFAFIIIDLLWLGLVAKDLYKARLGSLMATDIVVPAAALFYLTYLFGIIIFAVHPALQSGSWQTAAIWGALFGFFCYMTYELTNWAVIQGWPASLVLTDIIWGTVLTASVSVASYLITRLIFG